MTPCSPKPTGKLISHTLTTFDDNAVILDLSSTRKKQELISCIERTSTDCLNSSTQPSSSGISQTKTTYSKLQIPPRSKQEMADGITYIPRPKRQIF